MWLVVDDGWLAGAPSTSGPDPLGSVTLRPAEPTDALAWAQFLAHCQGETYRGVVPEDFVDRALAGAPEYAERLAEAFTADDGSTATVAVVEEQIIGVSSVSPAPSWWEQNLGYTPPPATWQLSRLYVDHAWHGTGLAQRLFDAVLDDRDVYLWLIDGNSRAQRFYQRRGFVDIGDSVPAGETWGYIPMHRMVRTSG